MYKVYRLWPKRPAFTQDRWPITSICTMENDLRFFYTPGETYENADRMFFAFAELDQATAFAEGVGGFAMVVRTKETQAFVAIGKPPDWMSVWNDKYLDGTRLLPEITVPTWDELIDGDWLIALHQGKVVHEGNFRRDLLLEAKEWMPNAPI